MRRNLLAAAAIAATLLLAGCSASGTSTPGELPVGQPDSGGVPAPAEGGGKDGYLGGDGAVDEDARDVITSGTMTVTADDPIAASAEAVSIVEAAGGRIEGRSERTGREGEPSSAYLTLRIPSERLQGVIDDLKGLGRSDEVSLDTDDVTMQTQDIGIRIGVLRASIERLTTLIARAEKTDDLIALEREISDRQAQLESLEAQQRDLADRVAMSTIQLTLRAPAAAPKVGPSDFPDGVATGWAAFAAFWSWTSIALGIALPWLVFLGLIAGVVWLLVRFLPRRRSAA